MTMTCGDEQSAQPGPTRPAFIGEAGAIHVSSASEAAATWFVAVVLAAAVIPLVWMLFLLEDTTWTFVRVILITALLAVFGIAPALRAIWAFRIGPDGITVVRTFSRRQIPWSQIAAVGFGRSYEPTTLLPILRWWYRTLDIYLPNGKHLRAIIGRRGRQKVEAVVQGLLPEDSAE